MPQERRERREAAVHSHAKGRPLAQDNLGPMRLGRCAQEGRLSPGPVPQNPFPAWSQKSHLRHRRFDPYRHIPHAQRRYLLSRPWSLVEIEKEEWARKMQQLLRRACHAANKARERG